MTSTHGNGVTPAPPSVFYIFGAHGDLTRRLLVPALYSLFHNGMVDQGIQIVGIDHNASDDNTFRARLGAALRDQVGRSHGQTCGAPLSETVWNRFARQLYYLQGDFLREDTYRSIREYLAAAPTQNAVFYLATPPRFFVEIIRRLADAGLLNQSDSHFRRIVIEKPFGTDLASARQLNEFILCHASESQIYRIDHFLGKETVQNILISRFANSVFEAFWNKNYIDHVQITAAESVGVGSRGRFYEGTGALRDMVPNHLFQLLALTAMEPPAAFGADAIRDEKIKVLGAIRPWTPDEALRNSVRGQYEAGEIDGQPVPGYRDEENVAPDSTTETYVALKLYVDNWRWAGVPFYLRTGKRMSCRSTEVAIYFKPAPYALFRNTSIRDLKPNCLLIRIQPDEGMQLEFYVKRPGQAVRIDTAELGFTYADYFEMPACTGYETLVYDCLTGDQTLFQRADGIEHGWRAVQPFLDVWASGAGTVEAYAAGLDGPASAQALIGRDGRTWRRLKSHGGTKRLHVRGTTR